MRGYNVNGAMPRVRGATLGLQSCDPAAELRACDELPPLTRAALKDCCQNTLATNVLAYWRRAGLTDAAMARLIREKNAAAMRAACAETYGASHPQSGEILQ